ncbi:DedA family protein [Haladaptatus sp.]|uniref:DedA family protein n=1 Tax=Haladaptatus sp. TaxID=1973141 RepID=UPI003C3E0132
MHIASLVAVETTFPSLLILSVFGLALMSFTTDSRSLRTFVADYGVFLLAGGVALTAVAGILLFLFGDETLAKRWLHQYGLFALFFIFILEGAMMLYFAPSETVVPIGVAVLASSSSDYRMIVLIVGVAVVASTIGQYALFLLAKRGGREYLLEKPWFRIDDSSLDRFDHWFQRWGPVAIPLSNTLPFTRGMLTVPAGFGEMRDRDFIVLSAIGSLCFESLLAIFGPKAFAVAMNVASQYI